MTTSTISSTRSLAALLGVGALTLSLAACGDDDDRTPGQLGEEPEAQEEDEPDEEPEEDDAAEEPEEEEPEEEDLIDEPDEEDDPLDEEDDAPSADADLEFDEDIACQMIDTSLLDDLAGGNHSFETDNETAFSGNYFCRWESEDYTGDLLEDDYYGGIFFDATVRPGDDLVTAEEYFGDHKDSATFPVTELDDLGVDAYQVEELGTVFVLFDDDHYVSFMGSGDFWDDHGMNLVEEFVENWENK